MPLANAGGAVFIRNGGHDRWTGFTDHHILHYCTTVACCIHVNYVLSALAGEKPWPYNGIF